MSAEKMMAKGDLVRELAQGAQLKMAHDAGRKAGLLYRAATVLEVERNPLAPAAATVPLKHGGSLYVNIRDYVGAEIFVHGMYEPNVAAFLVRRLGKGDCFIDVGAHFGYFSHLAATRVGDQGKVLSIEPARNTLNYLKRNTASFDQVEVHPVAAWHKRDSIEFYDYGNAYSCLNTTIGIRWARKDIGPPDPKSTYSVEAIPVDEIAADVTPKIVKIDVENAEEHVLKGMTGIIARHKPMLVFEVCDIETDRAEGAQTSGELIQTVRALGYEVHEIANDGNLSKFQDRSPLPYMNLAATPV